MKRQSKYILAVYAAFSLELLINIVMIWFYVKYLPKSFADIFFSSKIRTWILIELAVSCILYGPLEEKIKNKTAGILSLLILVPTWLVANLLIATVSAAFALGTNYRIVLYAFWITFVIFLSMTIWGFLTRRKNYHHPILSRIFISSCIVSIFNIFWGWNWINIIIDVIDIIVVSFFIYLDTVRIKQHAEKLMTENSILKVLNILMDSYGIYIDFALIWADITDLMVRAGADSN